MRIILDDKKARRIARQLGLPVTVAVLLRAKERGIISAVGPIINSLRAVNFRVSKGLIEQTLGRAGE